MRRQDRENGRNGQEVESEVEAHYTVYCKNVQIDAAIVTEHRLSTR